MEEVKNNKIDENEKNDKNSMEVKGFNYTEWQESLWEGLTLEEVFERAKNAQEKHKVHDEVDEI